MQMLKHWDLVKDTLGFKLSFRPQIGAFVPHTVSVVSVAILQAIEMLGISVKGQQTSSEGLVVTVAGFMGMVFASAAQLC